MNDNRTKIRKKLFYTGLFLYCVPTILQTTLLVENSYFSELFVWLRYIAFGLGIVLIAEEQVIWDRGRKFHLEFSDIRRSIWCFAILAVAGISSLISGDRSFLACIILIMASGGMDLDQIVKSVFAMLTGSVLLTVGLCKVGLIEDLMFKRQDIPIRHALGFNYPSTVMSYLFFAAALYCWGRKMKCSLIEFLMIEVLNVILFKLTDSRFGFLMTAVMTVGVYVCMLIRRRYPESDIFRNRIIGFLADGFGIFMTIVTAVLCAVFQTGFGQFMDRLLTKRIQYMVSGFRNYGVHLFGKHIEWIGFGGSDNTDSLLASYNFVDNSYARILMNYGVLTFILTLIILVVICRAVRQQYSDGRIFLILCVLLYCFIEPRLTDIYVNPFLFAAAPFIRGTFLGKEKRKR